MTEPLTTKGGHKAMQPSMEDWKRVTEENAVLREEAQRLRAAIEKHQEKMNRSTNGFWIQAIDRELWEALK
jgi:hypothetical protein